MHSRINELLAREDHLFLDPFTDGKWKHPQIPRSAYPEKPDEKHVALVQKQQSSWLEQKEKIFISAKIKRVVLPPPEPPRKSASSLGDTIKSEPSPNSAMLQAMEMLGVSTANLSGFGQNSNPLRRPGMQLLGNTNANHATALSVAQAELAAQRMRAQAIRNAQQERVYNSNRTRYTDYTPGNF